MFRGVRGVQCFLDTLERADVCEVLDRLILFRHTFICEDQYGDEEIIQTALCLR